MSSDCYEDFNYFNGQWKTRTTAAFMVIAVPSQIRHSCTLFDVKGMHWKTCKHPMHRTIQLLNNLHEIQFAASFLWFIFCGCRRAVNLSLSASPTAHSAILLNLLMQSNPLHAANKPEGCSKLIKGARKKRTLWVFTNDITLGRY